tara:strand:+ start:80 stop:544 length:465 start_codon:yes stop_codon:yes gene_type:complete
MLIQKTTEHDRKINTNAYDQMMFSFFDVNILGFKRSLCDSGEFLGKSKLAFLSLLNTKFNELIEKEICGACIHTGISVDQLPGCEVMEVRYALSHDLLDENGMFRCLANSPIRENEVVIRLAFQFKEGKVIRIARTRKYHQVGANGCDKRSSFN